MNKIQMVSLVSVITANLTTFLFLYFQTDKKVEAMQKEMTDFQIKMCSPKERNKKV